MKLFSLTFFILCFFVSRSQNHPTEEFVNEVILFEIPADWDYYLLDPIGLKPSIKFNPLNKFEKLELLSKAPEFPNSLLHIKSNDSVDWRNYNLKKARFLPPIYQDKEMIYRKLEKIYVSYTIDEATYNSLFEKNKIDTIYLKKKWFWNKNNIYSNKKFKAELLRSIQKYEDYSKENYVFFSLSKPVFSINGTHAQITIYKKYKTSGYRSTNLYKFKNGKWVKLIEYNKEEYTAPFINDVIN